MSDALYRASEKGDLPLVQSLVTSQGESDLNYRDSEYGYTPLIVSAEYEHWAVTRYLLTLPGVDTDMCGVWGESALHWACARGCEEEDILGKMVGRMSEGVVNKRNLSSGNSAIMMAVMFGHVTTVSILAMLPRVKWDQEELVRTARYGVCGVLLPGCVIGGGVRLYLEY